MPRLPSPTLRGLATALVAGLLGVVIWAWVPRAPERETATAPDLPAAIDRVKMAPAPAAAAAAAAAGQAAPPMPAGDPARMTVLPTSPEGLIDWPDGVEVAERLRARDDAPAADLEGIQLLLADYVRVFGAAPEGGTNAELTRALLGDNPRRVRFLPPTAGLLNGDGELLDRWGTPYEFHKLSGRRVDVRSAGPDQEMRTADDLVAEGPGNSPPL